MYALTRDNANFSTITNFHKECFDHKSVLKLLDVKPTTIRGNTIEKI